MPYEMAGSDYSVTELLLPSATNAFVPPAALTGGTGGGGSVVYTVTGDTDWTAWAYQYPAGGTNASNVVSLNYQWYTSPDERIQDQCVIHTYPSHQDWYQPCVAGVSNNFVVNWNFNQSPEAIAEQEARAEKWKEANDRAEDLLLMCLPLEQREQYLRDGFLEINVDKRKYRIKKGWSGNVELLGQNGKAESSFCIHPDMQVPNADNMLAQKLMLETNEAEFLRIANRTKLR